MMQAEAADSGLNIGTLLGVGGPTSIATLLLAWLAKLWLDARQGKREDTKTERESESGIVETTGVLTALVRKELLAMATTLGELRAENSQLRQEIAMMRIEHDKMQDRITGLEFDNEQLRRDRGSGRE